MKQKPLDSLNQAVKLNDELSIISQISCLLRNQFSKTSRKSRCFCKKGDIFEGGPLWPWWCIICLECRLPRFFSCLGPALMKGIIPACAAAAFKLESLRQNFFSRRLKLPSSAGTFRLLILWSGMLHLENKKCKGYFYFKIILKD